MPSVCTIFQYNILQCICVAHRGDPDARESQGAAVGRERQGGELRLFANKQIETKVKKWRLFENKQIETKVNKPDKAQKHACMQTACSSK